MTDNLTALQAKTKEPLRLWRKLIGKGFRSPALWVLFALLIIAFWALTLWGIAAPFQWGHHGFHAGFHGSNARTLIRHGVWTPAHYSGQAAPPESTYYLHHPILMHPYLSLGFILFGQEDWVVRMVPAFFTFLGLLALFWVAGRIFNPWTALLASVAFVFLPQNLIFSHLIDHETPGLFYSLLGCGAFLLWMEPNKNKRSSPNAGQIPSKNGGFQTYNRATYSKLYGAVALICLALSGLSDWPPFVIAFFLGLYGWAHVTARIRLFPKIDNSLPRGLAGTIAVVFMTLVIFYSLHDKTKFPLFYKLLLTMGGVLVMSTNPGKKSVSSQEEQPKKNRVMSQIFSPEAGKLAAWSFVALAVFAFHFYYTYKVGAWPDLKSAFSVRTGGGLDDTFFKNYREYILELMFTQPMLLVGVFWALLLPARAFFGKLPSRVVLPLAFLCGQLFHNLKFPNEINMHNYRAYYYAGFFPLALADLALLWSGGLGWLRKKIGERSALYANVFITGAVVVSMLLVFFLFRWQIREAWPSYKLSRERSGTLSVTPYRSHRHKIRFYREVNKLTTPETFILYGDRLHPRFEALWYLDRDYGKIRRAPATASTAKKTARRLFWNPRVPKPKNRFLLRLWPDLTKDEIKQLDKDEFKRKPFPPFERPVAALLDLRDNKAMKDMARLAPHHTVRIFHPMACILYDDKGPDIKAYRFVAGDRHGLERYLYYRDKKLLTIFDPGLTEHWKKRINENGNKAKNQRRAKNQRKTKDRLRTKNQGRAKNRTVLKDRNKTKIPRTTKVKSEHKK